MGSNKILSSSLRSKSKSRKIQPTSTGGEEKSNGKQQKEQQKNSSSSNHQKSNSKRLSSTLSSSDNDSTLSESNVERREKKKLHRGTISRWNRWCSWVEEEPTSDNNDGSLYHILDDSGGHDGMEGDDKCCLDVSDSKWLSLMDVLLKDELSFLGKS